MGASKRKNADCRINVGKSVQASDDNSATSCAIVAMMATASGASHWDRHAKNENQAG